MNLRCFCLLRFCCAKFMFKEFIHVDDALSVDVFDFELREFLFWSSGS